jgi:Uma2 family endonuclease
MHMQTWGTGWDRPITGEEFSRLPEDEPCELVEGRVVAVTRPGREHGLIEGLVAFQLQLAIRQFGIRGQVLVGDVGVYTGRSPDTVRGPDVAFISDERLSKQTRPDGFLDVPPELVVEIKSSCDHERELRVKAGEYLRAGVVVVMVVDPRTRTCHLHRQSGSAIVVPQEGVFETPDVLPGVRIPARLFFE